MRQKKENYFELKQAADKAEIRIQESMMAHERGLVSIDAVQRINKKAIKEKYAAEVAN